MSDTIKKGSKRAMAQPFLERFAAEGLSANKALGRLRELGLGYRRKDFLDDYRKYTGRKKAEDVAKFIRKDRYPTEAVMSSDPRNWRRQYNNIVEYTVRDIETGAEYKKRIIEAWDTLKTVGEIEQAAFEHITDNLDYYHSELVDLKYVGTIKGW